MRSIQDRMGLETVPSRRGQPGCSAPLGQIITITGDDVKHANMLDLEGCGRGSPS